MLSPTMLNKCAMFKHERPYLMKEPHGQVWISDTCSILISVSDSTDRLCRSEPNLYRLHCAENMRNKCIHLLDDHVCTRVMNHRPLCSDTSDEGLIRGGTI